MTTYNRRGFTVTIDDDGSLLVKAGDMLSGYSMAIHGDFDHIHDYSRKKNGVLFPVENVDLIYAGETLWHEPSIPDRPGPGKPRSPESALPRTPTGEPDIPRILEKYNLPYYYYDPVKALIDSGRGARAVVSLAGFFAKLGGAAFINSAFGTLLGTVASCYALWKARNYSMRHIGFRGTSYGVVSWAFEDGVIPLPEAIATSLIRSGLPDDVAVAQRGFAKAQHAVHQKLDEHVRVNGLDPALSRVAVQALGGNPKEWDELTRKRYMAGTLLCGSATYYGGGGRETFDILQPWSWYPNDQYVGRPTYPGDLNKRYPYSP